MFFLFQEPHKYNLIYIFFPGVWKARSYKQIKTWSKSVSKLWYWWCTAGSKVDSVCVVLNHMVLVMEVGDSPYWMQKGNKHLLNLFQLSHFSSSQEPTVGFWWVFISSIQALTFINIVQICSVQSFTKSLCQLTKKTLNDFLRSNSVILWEISYLASLITSRLNWVKISTVHL